MPIGQVLMIGAIVVPIVMFVAFFGVTAVDSTKTNATAMDGAADGLTTSAGASR